MVTSKTGYAEIKGRAMPTIFEMGNAQKTLSKTGNSLQREGDAQNIQKIGFDGRTMYYEIGIGFLKKESQKGG